MGNPSDLRERFVDRFDDIPALPQVVQKVVALCNDPMTAIRDFEDAFAAEPALASRILRLVNSGYFALPNPVSDISRAVTFLGFEAVRAVALSVGAFHVMGSPHAPGFDARAFWNHAVAASETSRLVSRRFGLGAAEDAHTSGLFSRVATLVLHAHFPADVTALVDARDPDVPLHDPFHERKVLGTDHAELGGLLLGHWGLPKGVVEGVAHQYGSDDALRRCGAALSVHIAHGLVHQWGHAQDSAFVPLRPVAAHLLEEDPATAQELEEAVKRWLDRVQEVLA